MKPDLSILQLVLNASWVVQLVMLLLVAVSIASWAAIFRKLFALKRVNALNDDFERDFWSGISLNDLFAAAAQNAKLAGPMERIFASGMREYQKLRERRVTDTERAAGRRAPRHAGQLTSVSWTPSKQTFRSWPRSVRFRPTSACSAPSGASCTPSPAWPACKR